MFPQKLIDKFHSKYIEQPNGCWQWVGCSTQKGYGMLFKTHYVGDKKLRYYSAHRFSYMLYNSNDPLQPGDFVCHKCDNPSCVNPEHLERGNNAKNTKDAYDRGLREPVKGEAHGRAILTEADVIEIIKSLKRGERIAYLARQYGVSTGTIDGIKHNRRWTHIPG